MKRIIPESAPPTGPTGGTLYRPAAFATLSDAELVTVYSAPIRKYAKGDVILDEKEPGGSSYVILTGAARMSWNTNASGLLAALGRGEWFGRAGSSEHLPYAVLALEPSTVMKLSSATVEGLSHRVQSAIHQALAGSMLKAFKAIHEEAGQSTHRLDEVLQLESRRADKTAASTNAFAKRFLSEIPNLPPYANNLAIKLLDETTTPQEVADGIKQDPALAALVLQRVNSSYYSLSTKISDYYRACLLLGMSNIYRLVMSEALHSIMPNNEKFRAIQEHSFMVSLLAHDVAQLSGKVPPQLAATAGLLHDVGKGAVLMFKQRHADIADAFDLLDDTQVGGALLQGWQLPEGIVKVIESQNLPAYLLPEQLPAQHRHSIATLYLSHICAEMLSERNDEPTPQTFAREYLECLGFEDSSVESFVNDKVYPELVKNQKRLPKSMRAIFNRKHQP